MFFTSGLAIVSYVLLAWGLFTIAKRRGINKPWLAWIPVVNVWMLGCISDQYRQVARGQVKSKRKAMLTLAIIEYAAIVLIVALAVVWIVGLIGNADLTPLKEIDLANIGDMSINELTDVFTDLGETLAEGSMDYLKSTLWMPIVITVISLAMSGVAIALMVIQYMAYADVFASTDPGTAKLFTVLGIVLSVLGVGIVLSVLVFLNKDKDLGMPPRAAAEATNPVIDAEN